MKKQERRILFTGSLLLFAALFIYNFQRQSQWTFDATMSIAFLILIYSLNKWIKLTKTGFFLLNVSLLLHNMGSFGWYAWTHTIFGYDNIVHFVSSFATAFILYNFLARKLHIKKGQRVKTTVIDENIVIFTFLVLASVAFLGVGVELMEFGGFWFLGSGEGILFVGPGDYGTLDDAVGQYVDTMTDIIVNTLGALVGVVAYYFLRYKKRPWLRYA